MTTGEAKSCDVCPRRLALWGLRRWQTAKMRKMIKKNYLTIKKRFKTEISIKFMARKISKRVAKKAFKSKVANVKSRNKASQSMTRRGGICLTVN